MALAKTTTKKKKAPTISARKSVTAEERHVGLETVNWSGVINVEAAMYETLRHYSYFYDLKDGVKWIAAWMKKHMSKEDLATYQRADACWTSMTAAGLCKMHLNGAPFDQKRIDWIKSKILEAMAHAKEAKTSDAANVTSNPAEIVKQKSADFIAEIEAVLDDFHRGVDLDISNYSVYNELKKVDAAANTARAIIHYYTPLKLELEELLQKKSADLVEAYKQLTLSKKKEYLKLISSIIDDSEKYLNTKKAMRKPRAVKAKSAVNQLIKLQYLKESAELKLASVDPINLVGASVVYLYNVSMKQFARVVTNSSAGFAVKGTSLQNVDLTASTKKRMGDAAKFRALDLSTKTKAAAAYNNIKSTEMAATGRLGPETLIVKVFK